MFESTIARAATDVCARRGDLIKGWGRGLQLMVVGVERAYGYENLLQRAGWQSGGMLVFVSTYPDPVESGPGSGLG